MKPIAKKKAPVVSPEKLRELANGAMDDFTRESKKRYERVHKLFERQDDETQDAIERMTALLCRIARKNMWVSAGSKGDRVVLTIPEEVIYHNMFYMAVEILKDLAEFDVKVAGFHFPPNLCAECFNPVKPKKAAKKKVKS
jgi:hypothetical protein